MELQGTRSVLAAAVAAASLALPTTAMADVWFVNSTADTASTGCPTPSTADACTLRQALTLAGQPGADTISFTVGGPFDVATALPDVPAETYLNGGSAGGIELRGNGATFSGLRLAGSGSEVEQFIIHGFGNGIAVLAGGDASIITGSLIGLLRNGNAPAKPNSGDGIRVLSGAKDVIVGNPYYYSPTTIGSNKGWGIALEAGSGPSHITGTAIGMGGDLCCALTQARPNAKGGIRVDSSGNNIGDTAPCTTAPEEPYCNQNYVSGNGGPGIVLSPGTSANRIEFTIVGMDGTTATALPNQGHGIVADGTGHKIGAASEYGYNLVSGNTGHGMLLRGRGFAVVNNAVGIAGSGDVARPNGGVGVVSDASVTKVGEHLISGNVISGNTRDGIVLHQTSNEVFSNRIGTNASADAPLPNGGAGVRIDAGPQAIGTINGGNQIGHNEGPGVWVVAPTGGGAAPAGVSILVNELFANSGLGIDLGAAGSLPNDSGDGDGGPNGGQNFPLLTAASAADGKSAFHGSVDAAPKTRYDFNLYASNACDPSGHGEGGRQVAGGFVNTDADGHGFLGFEGPSSFAAGDVLSATLTGPDGSTSEFSPCIEAVGGVNLTVDQSVSEAAFANREFELVVGVRNSGPARATGVVLLETLPSNTELVAPPNGCAELTAGSLRCAVEDLARDARAERRFLLRSRAAGTFSNRVALTVDQVETAPDDNKSDLGFSVADDPATQTGPNAGTSLDELGPVFAKSVRIDRKNGVVTARLPSGREIRLDAYAVVPVGTEIDASKGKAKITAALQDTKSTITADFRAGAFRVGQSAKEQGLTEVRLIEPLACARANAGTSKVKKRGKRARRRHLWGKARGRFRMRGRHSATTVRGTAWRVLDSCDSTETWVREGVVEVAGLRGARPRRTVLRAGDRVVVRRR